MNVLVLNALSALRGGGQTYLINFLDNLPIDNIKVILLVNTKNKDLFEPYSSEIIYVHEVITASKNIFSRVYWELFELPKYLIDYNATVYYAPGGIMVTKIPNGIISATALRNMLPFDNRERKRFSLFSCIRFKLWVLKYVFLLSYRMADKVIFISKYSQDVIKQAYPKVVSKSLIVPHGLNELFQDAHPSDNLPQNLEQNKFYLYVSQLDVYKAQKEMVLAWKKLKEKGFNFPLVLVGPNNNDYGDDVLKMIRELSLSDDVIYLGKIDYHKLPSLYKSARALIFASSCECCPNILLEKLAAAKPVLCSDIQPMPEFGENAVVYFEPYNSDTLVKQVELLESDQEKMKSYGISAGKQSLKFNWSTTVKKTLEFFFDQDIKG